MEERILDRANSLFLRYGIKSVSMDDLSKDLGVSKKTLYQYVPNKRALVSRLVDQHTQVTHTSMAEINDNAVDAIHAILRIAQYVVGKLRCVSPMVIYDLRKYYRDLWETMETKHRSFMYDLIKKNLERGKEQGLYRRELNADIISKLYVGKTTLVSDKELFPDIEYNQEDLFREYMTYHLHGIVSLKGIQLLEYYQKNELKEN